MLLDHNDLPFFPQETRNTSRGMSAFSLCIPVPEEYARDKDSISVVPDRLFSIVFPDNTRVNVAPEVDRGDVPQSGTRRCVRRSTQKKIATATW
jgi:hypothetical protein